MTSTATIRPVRSIEEEHTGDTLVIATGRKERVVGTVRPVGNAFRVMDADGVRQLALVSLKSQAIAWFKYNH